MYSPLFTRLGREYQMELERKAEQQAARRELILMEETAADRGERMQKLVEAAEKLFAATAATAGCTEENVECQFCMEGGD